MPQVEYSQEEILSQLSAYVEECGTKAEAARQLGISAVYLGDILAQKRGISAEIADKLGFTKKTIFVQGESHE